MKSFYEYLAEAKEIEGLLNIFDIDDTLFRSKTSVVIMKDGKPVKGKASLPVRFNLS